MAVVEEKLAEAVRKYSFLKIETKNDWPWEDEANFYIFKIKSSITKGHFLHQRMVNTFVLSLLKKFRTFLFLVAFVDVYYVLIINTAV